MYAKKKRQIKHNQSENAVNEAEDQVYEQWHEKFAGIGQVSQI